MPRVSDLLDRFRPAGAPGPAGTVGIPGDRRAAAGQELAPAFAALDDAVRSAANLRQAAAAEARQQVERATLEAAELIARARADEAAERAEAATAVRALAERELIELATEAEAEAERLRRRATQRLPAVLEMIVTHARARLAALVPGEAGEPRSARVDGAPR